MVNAYMGPGPQSGVSNPGDWVPSSVEHPLLAQDYFNDLVDRALAQRQAEDCLGPLEALPFCSSVTPS